MIRDQQDNKPHKLIKCFDHQLWRTIVVIHSLVVLYFISSYKPNFTISSSGMHSKYETQALRSFTGRNFRKDNMTKRLSHRFYRIQNVCIQGGTDGLYVRDLKGTRKALNLPFQEENFLQTINPASLKEMSDESQNHVDFVQGPSYFLNCWHVSPSRTNPMHILPKTISMYSLAEESLFKDTPLFENMVLHQCPSHAFLSSGKWEMGSLLWNVGLTHWEERGLWKGPNATNIYDFTTDSKGWKCFEDLYVDADYGTMAPHNKTFGSRWKSDLFEAVGITNPNQNQQLPHLPSEDIRNRCREKKLQIHIFQRKAGDSNYGKRAFVNINEVKNLLQTFTNETVKTLTVDGSMSVKDQAKVFQGFDLLVTPHGSHLVNMIFSPEDVAIIEVVPAVYDTVFQKGSKRLGIKYYKHSMNHLPAGGHPTCRNGSFGDIDSFVKENMRHCDVDAPSCDHSWSMKWIACDMMVDLDNLRTHIESAISRLCDN